MICNFPLTTKYSVRDDHIYGPARPLLQGFMKLHMNLAVKVTRILLPADILLHHTYIELYIDLFYINGIHFLHKKSCNITFLTAEIFSSKSADKIIQELHTVANMYTAIGFNISV